MRSLAGVQTLEMPSENGQAADKVYLSGQWDLSAEFARCVSGCRLRIRYSSRQVNIVASGTGNDVRVSRDGVLWGTTTLSGATLYTVIDGDSYGEHVMELEFAPGQQIYSLTFG
jgi:hypothetical protein